MLCNIYRTVRYVGLSEKKIRGIVFSVLGKLGKKNAELSVNFVGDKKMQKLNRDYKGKNKTTDVLSFSMQEGRNFDKFDLGDIFISIPQVKKQSEIQNISYKEELVRMIVHGILHLNGYDHRTKKEESVMFSLQEKMVESFVKKV
jgi:probable rRNA maturation factor